MKIKKAEDWRINWGDYDNNLDKNPLANYTENSFPKFDSVTNWLFNFQLKRIIDDPNGAILYLPLNIEEILDTEKLNPNEPFKPFPFYIKSTAIAEFNENILVYQKTIPARPANGGKASPLKVMYLIDKEEIVRITESDKPNTPEEAKRFTFNADYVPAISCGGFILELDNDQSGNLFDSFIAPALPFWNKAISGEADLDIDKALHLHPDRWEYGTKACTAPNCKNGEVFSPVRFGQQQQSRPCKVCQGTGHVANRSPFGVLRVNMEKTSQATGIMPPTPPAGYITRDIESIKITKELIDGKIYDGLSALNLEFLANVPLNTSGKSKEFDRQEIDAYISTVASHLVEVVLRNTYYFCNFWINKTMPEYSSRAKFEPTINTPRKFDLVTTDVWQQRVSNYSKDNSNASARSRAEIKLAEKQYGGNSIDFLYIRDTIELDPLYGKTEDEKVSAHLSGGCTQIDYIISCQIGAFVRRAALESNNKFFGLDYGEKIAQLEVYAEAVRKKLAVQAAGVVTPASPAETRKEPVTA